MDTPRIIFPQQQQTTRFRINDAIYQTYNEKTRAMINSSAQEMDKYVREKLPEGHIIEAGQDIRNGKGVFLLTHIGDNVKNTIAVLEADYYKTELVTGKNPVKVFIDIIAEGLEKAKKIKV